MRPPLGALPFDLTDTLTALLTAYERDGRATIDSVVAVSASSRSRDTVRKHLVTLRDFGLVDFADGLSGTLRPAVSVVAHTPRSAR